MSADSPMRPGIQLHPGGSGHLGDTETHGEREDQAHSRIINHSLHTPNSGVF